MIVDDVITAGTAIGEAMKILENAQAKPCGVCISLDRQEKVSKEDPRSAIQVVQEKYGLQVVSIANLNGLVDFLEQASDNTQHADAIKAYRAQYGLALS